MEIVDVWHSGYFGSIEISSNALYLRPGPARILAINVVPSLKCASGCCPAGPVRDGLGKNGKELSFYVQSR